MKQQFEAVRSKLLDLICYKKVNIITIATGWCRRGYK